MPAGAANSPRRELPMPATLDVSCPNCDKPLKVPAELEGKKVKCKGCEEVFVIKAPKAKTAAPSKKAPAAKKPAPETPKAEEKPPEKPKSPFLDEDDDDDGQAPKPMAVVKEDDAPRCPHCANELDPPDAIVCYICGYNNVTRVKSETKKVIEHDAADWATHLATPIIALIIVIGLIVLDIICILNMSDWMAGSALEKDEKNPVTGNVEYYVKPGAFTTFIIVATLAIIVPFTRFAIRRLMKKPEEKVKK